ncbi:cGMP-dependent protein kinase 1-like [Sinocyclocheilus anshuiensis]|uniref:cGMP-dependent protein kinase 1-like n=1 Tax=Sinocyclocheilus anshuiensis TaxID=1608454 RepID=UPI0007B8D49D|nr:PREDICTED: cGMP-dependent protein kinase 1-like [Sinocyclocheilus anshuiensis]
MGTLRDLQFALQLKIEELRQRDALIDELELELDAKDDLIRRLQGELDRLRLSAPGASAAGQQRVSSLRVRRKALLTEPVTLEPKLVLQTPPISYSKSQELQQLIESAVAENECMKYLDRDQMRCLVDSAYPMTLKQGVSVVQEGDNGTQAYIVEAAPSRPKPTQTQQPMEPAPADPTAQPAKTQQTQGCSRSARRYPFPKRQGPRPKIALDPMPQASS